MDSSTHLWHPSPSDRWTRYGIAGGLLLLAVGGIAYGVWLEQNRGLGELDDPGKILIVDNEAQYLARWASHQPLHGTHRETLDFLAELDSAPETEPTSLAQILEQADRAGIGYVAISQEACQALGTAGCDDAKLQESSDPAFWAVFPVGDLAIGEVASYAVLPQSVQVRSHLRKRIGLMQAVHAQPLIQHFVTQSWASDLPARPDIRRSPTQKEMIVGGVALQQLK